nr:MAG TPA: hypothetical protein [Herelleviridae sp.]
MKLRQTLKSNVRFLKQSTKKIFVPILVVDVFSN